MLVSAAIGGAGAPRAIIDAWADERCELVISPALIQELGDVLHRPRLRRWISLGWPMSFSMVSPRTPR